MTSDDSDGIDQLISGTTSCFQKWDDHGGVEHCYGSVMDQSKDVVQSMAMMDMKG